MQHQQQVDEVVALSMIYPDEFHLISKRSVLVDEDSEEEQFHDENHVQSYEFPIKYSFQLSTGLDLIVEYPDIYPDEPPNFTLDASKEENDDEHDDVDVHIKPNHQNLNRLLDTIKAEIEIGMPCVLQCLQAGRDFLEEEGEVSWTLSLIVL